ncbi:Uncharacterised protein family (UPF0236) [Carnobacterium alterfunditum]|uniref:Uncharacterized protein family (UPF0236) n=1 Tax=Carnobacterium alterfunditum TaxID=28230 RepID=A0A1N6G574_9LACT|nr:ISLre2 family transposase [Carnobacterium alterfunditum]SIN98362.1 Uncharacterised protein family (UPF0236) [Carnobacterium alterfunditum]SIO02660.1 Uncharacterised protein family (UPF0236) [Carnobacterium alterfunditum]
MDIIQHVMTEISKMMSRNIELTQNKQLPFNELISNVQETMNQVGIALVEDYIVQLDTILRKDTTRKELYHVQRNKDQKLIATTMGDIILDRTYYKNKQTGEFSYLVDDYLELEPHARMDLGLTAAILEKAKDLSYQKTIDSFKNISIHSRSSVMNVVHKHLVEPTEADLPAHKKSIDRLYIEADEDHVAYQDGTNRFMKLVYVYEGRKESTGITKRVELQGKRYFTGLYPDNDDLWETVLDYLEEAYDLNQVKKIYISGDGAAWIKSGTKMIPKSEFVLDYFHLSKYIKKACIGHHEWISNLYRWIYSNEKELLKLYFKTRLDDDLRESERKALEESRRYILRHWEAIQKQKDPNYYGCSAEGHISHILSARLSSRPLGWSLTGAEHIAKLRAYTFNGGDIKTALKRENKTRIRQLAIKKLDKRVNRKYTQQFQPVYGGLPALTQYKKSPLSFVLKGIRGK